MSKPDVPAALKSLYRSLRHLKSLIAWAGLTREHQRPGVPPAFRVDRHLEQDIRAEYGFFLNTAMELNRLFNRGEAEGTEEQRRKWRRRLKSLEKQFRSLNIPTDL